MNIGLHIFGVTPLKKFITACFLFTFYCSSCFSNELTRDLALSNPWLGLLHYEEGLFSKPQSAIQSDDFFFSKTGHIDPLSELNATLSSFTDDPSLQCKFPARAQLLQQYFDLPKAHCDELNTFIQSINASSLSLIYASGYLGNPASMYGHVFLKFNQGAASPLLDNTYNYGARHPDNENPFKYIAKGIFGGYQGYFANQKYHHQTLIYNETELRDLWEYRLNLSTDEIHFVLMHLFELEGVGKTYYFFKQNCAYQLARLLDLVKGDNRITPQKPWVMPFDVITMMYRDDHESIIDEVIYHGSRQEKLYDRFSQLTKAEAEAVKQVLFQPALRVNAILDKLSETSAKRVIDTLYDYYAFVDQKNNGVSNEQSVKRKSLLQARFALAPGASEFNSADKKAPHLGQSSTLLQASFVHNDVLKNAIELRFRANYYDLLSVNAARIPFSELSTFDMRVRYYDTESSLTLHELTLLRIINLNATSTGLPHDTGYAWKLAAGYRPQSLQERGNGTGYVDGFIGKAIALSPDFAIYGAASGAITSKNDVGGNIAIGPEIGGVINLTPFYAMSLSFGHQRYLNDVDIVRNTMTLEQRFSDHNQMDFRMALRYDGTHELTASFSYYF